MLLITFSCGGTSLQMQSHQLPEQKEMMIKVLNLNIDTSPDIWMRFFEEREASTFWQQLQARGNKLEFDFENVPFPSIKINEQANELVTGIVKYLSFCPNTIKSLSFIGNPETGGRCRDHFNAHQLITYLPDEICQLTELEFLEVSHHRLRQLPKKIGNLSKLQALILTDNELEKLPKSISQLSSLKALSIEMNNFECLPACITAFKELKELYTDENDWLLDKELTKLTPELLKDYIYPSIPHSLIILCAKCIEKYTDQESPAETLLPIELQRTARRNLIIQAKKWPDNRMVLFTGIKIYWPKICFGITNYEADGRCFAVETLPYYLPKRLCNPENVKNILQDGIPIYLAPKSLEEEN
jgi:hypothetical protein